MPALERPHPDEYAPFFAGYVARVPDGDVLAMLETAFTHDHSTLQALPAERAAWRYAPDKWSVAQLVGHLADAERVFAFRALHVARGEPSALPGFDENAWVLAAHADARPFPALLEEWRTVRAASVSLFGSLEHDAWMRRGTVNGATITARALAFITLGHQLHHRAVLKERYRIG
jgi:hypothetical protein